MSNLIGLIIIFSCLTFVSAFYGFTISLYMGLFFANLCLVLHCFLHDLKRKNRN